MTDIRALIGRIVKEDFNIDIDKIDPDSELRDQVDLDSMRFVEIYAALVDELNVEIPSEIMEARTLNQIISVAEKAVQEMGAK